MKNRRKSMQGPVKHNALAASFGWVWKSIFSSAGTFEALYFTNSTALRAALPCKISCRFFILSAAGPLIARAPAPSPGLELWIQLGMGINSKDLFLPFTMKTLAIGLSKPSTNQQINRSTLILM